MKNVEQEWQVRLVERCRSVLGRQLKTIGIKWTHREATDYELLLWLQWSRKLGCRYSQLLEQLIALGRRWRGVAVANPRLGFLWSMVTGPAAYDALKLNDAVVSPSSFDSETLSGLQQAVKGVDAYEARIDRLRQHQLQSVKKVWRGHPRWVPPTGRWRSRDAILRGFKW